MIINLWSTPRTGSNWYVQYLLKEYVKINSRTKVLSQYFNSYHFINYIKPKFGDFIYEYEPKCSYKSYYVNKFEQNISNKQVFEKRKLSSEEEKNYRLHLLNEHNFDKNPIIFYHHIGNIDDNLYTMLLNKANKNIFLYRKDFKRQVSSYALAYGLKIFKPSRLDNINNIVSVEYDVLKNLTDKIIKWHKIDKLNSEIVCYEDLDFKIYEDLPKKQNIVDPFSRLDSETQLNIIELEKYFINSLEKNT